jgi:hypothetical protein
MPALVPLLFTILAGRHLQRALAAAAQALADNHHASDVLDQTIPRPTGRRPPRSCTDTDTPSAANTGTGTSTCDNTTEANTHGTVP